MGLYSLIPSIQSFALPLVCTVLNKVLLKSQLEQSWRMSDIRSVIYSLSMICRRPTGEETRRRNVTQEEDDISLALANTPPAAQAHNKK